ncbi:alpha-L-iduronidase-like [Diadema setosum]|uniref:alpha-L-iduronidase-like n=1 Tax=Diadema setosum TaxID=31175 RepID=UPI003B3A8542
MVALLHSNNLRPGFELMGNPSDWYTDLENSTQVYAWRDLVQSLALRYIDLYGLDYVSSWNFESWNEPDHHDFDTLNFTAQGFLNYYDACSEGLLAAHPSLKLGGPADSMREPDPRHPRKSWSLLDHCANGINYFTKEKGVRLDYISLHLKGGGHSSTIITDEIAKITEILEKYPQYSKTPFYNDEGDPLVGWSKPEWWRADTTYAAIVAKIIVQHQDQLIRQHPDFLFTLLSNDNGFLNFYPSYFDQRTLVARFQMNKTTPPSVQTVKKPVLSLMGLLSLLGERQVLVTNVTSGRQVNAVWSDLGVLGSVHTPSQTSNSDSWQAAILIFNSADTTNVTGRDSVQLQITGIKSPIFSNTIDSTGDIVYTEYILNNIHGNPASVWTQFKSPVYPTQEQFRKIRQNQEPIRISDPKSVTGPNLTLDLSISKPGVTVLHICAKPDKIPEKVTNLRLHRYTASDVLVVWDDSAISSRCILTFQVEHSIQGLQGPYQQINDVDLIFTVFVYSPDEQKKTGICVLTVDGWYRVRAVDYWNRPGPYSTPVQL